jgi:formylglycine-generating enzyme
MDHQKINYTPAALILLAIPLLFYAVPRTDEMVSVPGGVLETKDPETNQERLVTVRDFYLDKYLVTVGDFEKFQKATGYITQAEQFGNAAVFDDSVGQWVLVDSADFRYPQGPNKPKASSDHPVTQVSWNDAVAYANWKGKRLPTQWEWEYAARNARQSQYAYTWGSNLVDGTQYKANTWQGSFPFYNTVADGYRYTSPVGTFGENDLGLTDMGGNVWQWCIEDQPTREAGGPPEKIMRGGSFLCDPNICHGFQVTGQASSTPESSLMHVGFRCARDTDTKADF